MTSLGLSSGAQSIKGEDKTQTTGEFVPDPSGSSPALGTGSGRDTDSVMGATSPLDGDASTVCFIVVMGVSGTGKSTLGAALAGRLGLPFVDGDDLHPAANVAKMSRGEPLDDADRRPWLERIRRMAVERVTAQMRESVGRVGSEGESEGEGYGAAAADERGAQRDGRRSGVVIACSALKQAYRAVLRKEGAGDAVPLPTWFVYLKGDRELLMERMLSRQGHFMKAGMLESQLAALESPEDEPGVVSVSVAMSTEEQVESVLEALQI